MKCKICSGLNKKKISYIYTHEKIKYYRCENCFFIFQNPLPSKKKLNKIYNNVILEKLIMFYTIFFIFKIDIGHICFIVYILF